MHHRSADINVYAYTYTYVLAIYTYARQTLRILHRDGDVNARSGRQDETPAPLHSLYCLRKLIGWICIHFVERYFRPESIREIEIISIISILIIFNIKINHEKLFIHLQLNHKSKPRDLPPRNRFKENNDFFFLYYVCEDKLRVQNIILFVKDDKSTRPLILHHYSSCLLKVMRRLRSANNMQWRHYNILICEEKYYKASIQHKSKK